MHQEPEGDVVKVIAILLCAVILFGCIGEERVPPENRTNGTEPPDGKPPVGIIIDPQKNQTVGKNETYIPPPPPEENESTLGYVYDADALLGVFFIDVGGPGLHGDAILLKKGDLDVLIDCGPVEKSGKVVDFLRSYEVDDIEVLVSTGADPRRYGGIGLVTDNFEIEELWWGGDTLEDVDYAAYVDKASAKADIVKEVKDGSSAELNGITFTALNPPASEADRFFDVNNDGIVLRVDDRNFSMLLTSGIQTGAQGRLINTREELLVVDVMQAPYYGVGAGTSAIGLLLLAAEPENVIITGSSDDSAANGGSREPFEKLMEQYGIEWHESYADNGLRITSDGSEYAIQSIGTIDAE